jgi:4-hydroxy-tetrahydrodipicolinate reductase
LNRDIRVVQVGLGPLGKMIAKHIINERKGIRYVGAVDISPELVGMDLGEAVGLEGKVGVKVGVDAAKVFKATKPDIAIYTTTSFARDTFKQLEAAIAAKVDVISTCEQLSYPYFSEPKLAAKYDKLAREAGVSILGTGINPGFLMDVRPIVLTAACTEVKRLEITRRMDASLRRKPFQKKIGAGLTKAEFKRFMKEGKITGHVGLEESLCLIAAALDWPLDTVVVEEAQAVIAEAPVASPFYQVKKGQVKGVRQEAYGVIDGEPVIKLSFAAYLGADPSYDEVYIEGTPEIRARVSPCWHGDHGTVAMVVNLIPSVIDARPGVLTMNDLVSISFKGGEMSCFVKGKK